MNRIALKRAPGLLGRRSITVIEMKNSTSYGTLMAASSNNYEDTVYNPATLGKMKESSEWKTMVKFRLTSFVTLSAHAGYCVAGYPFVLSDFALLSAGTFLCSCSANVWNQLQEFPFDSQMDRTKSRPFIKKEISNLTGVKWGITMGVGGTAILAAINPTVAALGLANIGLYGFTYTRMKRKHWLNTQVGAIVGAIPPLMGYTAASGGSFGIEGTCVAAMLFFWQFPHYYALAANKNQEYTVARYRMLTTESMRNAMWFSFWSLVALTGVHLYILLCLQGPLHIMNYFGMFAVLLMWPDQYKWLRGNVTTTTFHSLFGMSILYLCVIVLGSYAHSLFAKNASEDYCPKVRLEAV